MVKKLLQPTLEAG